MTKTIRQSVRFNAFVSDILLNHAAPMWPELDDNLTALIHKIIVDWHRLRNEKGGRTERLEQRMDRQEQLMMLVCNHLGIDTNANNDTDHA